MNAKETVKSSSKNLKGFFNGAGKKCSGFLQSKTGNFVLVIVVILLINIVGSFIYGRLDLTLSDSYSLSPVSKETVGSLEEPLTVKLFFSKDLPAPDNGVARYVQDLMIEYKFAGGRNFRYEMVNMEDEKSKAIAQSYGITQRQVNEIASDQVKSRAVYTGLVIIHGDMIERINEITTTDGLEFKITGAIRKMTGKSDALLALKTPVKITFYASGDLKAFNIKGFDTVADDVKAVVEKVNAQNYRKLTYEFADPSLDKSTQQVAEKFGMQRIQWKDEVSPDGRHIAAGEGVLSIVLENDGRIQVIPLQLSRSIFGQFFIAGMDKIDERINNGVGLLLSKHSVIGYATGHGEKNLEDEREGSANFKKYLSGSYEIKPVDLTKEDIPDTIRTLVVNGPKQKFTDEELYTIDQFVVKGGSVLFLVDSFNEMRPQGGNPYGQSYYIPLQTGLEKFFTAWGVTVGKDYVMDKKCYIQRQGQGGSIPLYFIPMIERKSLDRKSPVTQTMKNAIFLKASSVTLNDGLVKEAGLSSSVLVSSSDESWKMQGQINLVPYMIQPPDPKALAKYPLTVSLEGKFKSVFGGERPAAPVDPKKPVDAKKSSVEQQRGIRESVKAGRVIIIGTSEIAGGQAIDPDGKSPDAALLANAVDWLSGDDKTPEMRSKGLDFNPIESTSDITRFFIKAVNVVLLPILVVVFGFIVWRLRIIRRRKIRAEFSKEKAHE